MAEKYSQHPPHLLTCAKREGNLSMITWQPVDISANNKMELPCLIFQYLLVIKEVLKLPCRKSRKSKHEGEGSGSSCPSQMSWGFKFAFHFSASI